MLEAGTEALVNTVNTVGVMGKGIALMFKEAFPANFAAYEEACKRGAIQVGRIFVTASDDLAGPKWIINLPTKKHWMHPTKLEWVVDGLKDLRRVLVEKRIRSVAIPPLGCGNGGLDWADVRRAIEAELEGLEDVEVVVYAPTSEYQNVPKPSGVEKLTPARALIAEIIRRYSILGIECTILEVQKLAWFLERAMNRRGIKSPLRLTFKADKYGPYADKLRHLLNSLDGSYLHCDKRLSDAGPFDAIWFDEARKGQVQEYLQGPEGAVYLEALEDAGAVIDGFESPLGMELLATVDWLLRHEGCTPDVASIKSGLAQWPGGIESAKRKLILFDDRLLSLALNRLGAESAAR
jgi:O-acetyl-ADP-ribose deacetylase (regulator of RNase III)